MGLANLLPVRRGLRILMYHRLTEGMADPLTVKVEQFKRQLDEIQKGPFRFVSGREVSAVAKAGEAFSGKQVLVTFDDGSQSFAKWAWPVLRERKIPVVMFLPLKFVGGYNDWDQDRDPLMSADTIRQLASEGVEFAFHGWAHSNYSQMSLSDIQVDLRKARRSMMELGIPCLEALAYPYGAWPKSEESGLKELLKIEGFAWAARIGNRLNRNTSNPYFLQRFDVRGDRSHQHFLWQLRFGAGR